MSAGRGGDGSLRLVLEAAGGRLTGERLRRVERAYKVAAHWHRDQRRYSGDPYITHPVAVAAILAEWGTDDELLCAGLLHDVLEDTDCPEAELVRDFGEPIVGLVRGMTRQGPASRRPPDWATSMDERLLMLKLADRLHNMRTLRFLPEAKRRQKCRETLEIIAPVAGRLGLEQVERELERLATAILAGRDGVRASFGLVAAVAVLLPRRARARWLEEWLGELHALPGRWARMRFAARLVAGMPRMARTLRRQGDAAP